jgi:hypothetical protein
VLLFFRFTQELDLMREQQEIAKERQSVTEQLLDGERKVCNHL